MKGFVCALLAGVGLMAVSAKPGPALPKGAWHAPVHAALQAAIERHSGDPDAYAVFDFDMTSPIGDC